MLVLESSFREGVSSYYINIYIYIVKFHALWFSMVSVQYGVAGMHQSFFLKISDTSKRNHSLMLVCNSLCSMFAMRVSMVTQTFFEILWFSFMVILSLSLSLSLYIYMYRDRERTTSMEHTVYVFCHLMMKLEFLMTYHMVIHTSLNIQMIMDTYWIVTKMYDRKNCWGFMNCLTPYTHLWRFVNLVMSIQNA